MEALEIYPNVIVYRNMFSDPTSTLEYFKNNNEWREWHTFGEQTDLNILDYSFSNFPSAPEWDAVLLETISNKNYYSVEILDIFYKTTKDYLDRCLVPPMPNWRFIDPQICKYKTDGGASPGVGMVYHTDLVQTQLDAPGPKAAVTCTMYLNDDYEGGEICFRIFKKSGESLDSFKHKPKAGDVLVFPSGPPYYHGVNQTTLGEKYFIRSFWHYQTEGTQDWRDSEAKYGKDVWARMEETREKEEILSGKYSLEKRNLKGVDQQ